MDYGPDNEILKSKFGRNKELPTFNPDDVIGRTFLCDPDENRIRHIAKITERIYNHDEDESDDPCFVKFRCSVNDNEYKDIARYIDIINHIEKNDEENNLEDAWKFRSIIRHQGPLSTDDKEYKGSRFNVLVNWESSLTS